jgi:hypothetical protein
MPRIDVDDDVVEEIVDDGEAEVIEEIVADPTNGPDLWAVAPKDNIAPDLLSLPLMDPNDLELDPDNARHHDDESIDVIKDSWALHGQQKPVVVQEMPDGRFRVRAGNGSVEAARALGWTKVAVTRTNLAGLDVVRFGIADNRTAELSVWNSEVLGRLTRLLADAGDGHVPGFTAKELAALRAADQKPLTDPDEVPEEPVTPVTQAGDVWLLGEHRLMCGDSRIEDHLKTLLNGCEPRLVFTDPPYGVAIGAKNRMLNAAEPGDGQRGAAPAGLRKSGRVTADIKDDTITPEQLKDSLCQAFKVTRKLIADDCSVFVCSAQGGDLSLMMMLMLRDAELPARHVMIWKKNQPTFSLGRLDYEYQHEPILFTWKKTHKRVADGMFRTSIWEVDRPRASPEHATTKPVNLPLNAILRHTDVGDGVLDIYLGSGTTIIAAHQAQRVGYGMEIDPVYCDVTLRRWADFTGLDPIRESDGASFRELTSAADVTRNGDA